MEARRRRWTLGLSLALGAALVAGCGAQPPGSGQDGNTIKIGVLTGLTGDYGPWGEAGLEATRIAADEINEAGGIAGRKVSLVVADNGSSVEGSVSGWKKLVELDKVVAVLGMESDGAVALLDESAASRVPVMCPACGTPTLDTKGGDYVWRLTSGDSDLGVALAQVALKKTDRIAALTQRGLEATESISNVFIKAFERGGGDVISDTRFLGDANSFSGDLETAFADSDTVLVSSGLEPGTRLLREWERRGHEGTLFMIPELITDKTLKIGGGKLQGHAFGVSPAYKSDSPAYQTFAKKYKARVDKEPSPALYEPNYYDQLIITALAAVAADRAGSEVTGQEIRNHLAQVANAPGVAVHGFMEGLAALKAGKDVDYVGASGPVDFNDHGGVVSIFSELVASPGGWKQGQFIELNPALRDE
ncbi:ABC transporter substrate-binding protein [Actinomadura mexicana]|uniref:Amino acid/amide ABC transporter substrate-binding protein, HAAT family n=1 Tax=Actinomadura mexicana TaxID=134959 RepID=A0A238UL58_9ACTN|nr:ABC transporter substrate-binding protein [Actinomadura mexicana]SNR22866.1 amino acid/amide ABC transporter substrate-binding protein, HAAT family [Actinomadura mexicana]